MVCRSFACVAVWVMLAAIAGCGSGNSSDADPVPVSEEAVVTVTRDSVIATEPVVVEAFSFATDDLCEWVSEAEVAAFVAAEFDWDGSAVEVEPERVGCQWDLTGDRPGYVSASDDGHDADRWFRQVADFDPEDPPDMLDIAVSGHPALRKGVLARHTGFGQFVFWVPSADEYLGFELAVPGQDVFMDDGFFAVADSFLEELGWAPPR